MEKCGDKALINHSGGIIVLCGSTVLLTFKVCEILMYTLKCGAVALLLFLGPQHTHESMLGL
jgi:hypothetical protein